MSDFRNPIFASFAGLFGSRIAIGSSAISTVSYQPLRGRLTVEFRESGKIYRYEKVPFRVLHSFWNAESTGRYFNKTIRSSYEFTLVE